MATSPEIKKFYSHGKLLLTGEYFVLDGALALAVPTRKGQSLTVEKLATTEPYLLWESYTYDGQCWFSGRFSLPDGIYEEGSDSGTGQRLEQILKAGQDLEGHLWREPLTNGLLVQTALEFPRDWGLGSSSTLIANLAKWWQVDAYQLLQKTFGGSGYDLTCAEANAPLFYRLDNDRPTAIPSSFYPSFHEKLHFLYLEKKQNSRSGIANYRAKGTPAKDILTNISDLSRKLAQATELKVFMELLTLHERIVAEWMETETVQQQLFPDFPGMIKSLGAWGGDFVLVASESTYTAVRRYFADKGYSTLIPFSEMVLSDENDFSNSN